MNPECPLRYNISSWRQLSNCKSNNSRDLKIVVTDYFNNNRIEGLKISVEDRVYGTLFATVLEARGLLVTPTDKLTQDLSKQTILDELYKYGFFINYDEELHLSDEQLEYLLTINKLGYDKIRILTVVKHTSKGAQGTNKVVAFQVDPLGDWLNVDYDPSESEYLAALNAGTAINLTDVSKTKDFQWGWLDFVANIEDIVKDNIDDMLAYHNPCSELDSIDESFDDGDEYHYAQRLDSYDDE